MTGNITLRNGAGSRVFRLMLAAALFLLVLLFHTVISYGATQITKPSSGAEKEAGKTVTITVKGDYTYGVGGLFGKNYLYCRITKDGDQVEYLEKSYASSLLSSCEFEFTPEEEGEYLVEVCRDINYDGETHIYLDPGNFTAEASVTLKVWKSIEGVEISEIADQTYTGNAITPAPVLVLGGKTLTAGQDYTADYADNINVSTESSKAAVTFTGIGYYKKTASASFNITPRDIGSASVSGIEDKPYTGSAVTQKPVVTLGGISLTEGTDYEVAYDNNTNAGTATVSITGIGNYTGSVSRTFRISQVSILSAAVSGLMDKTYSGSALTQSLTLTYLGRTLTQDTDYTLSYRDNTQPGTATVTITGKGNFKGSMVRTFSITEKASGSSGGSTTIRSPKADTEYAAGSKITVKVSANVFQYTYYKGLQVDAPNYIYVKVTCNGEKIHYDKYAYKSTSDIIEAEFTAAAAGKYEIRTGRDSYNYTAETTDTGFKLKYNEIAYENFVGDQSIDVYVGTSSPSGSTIDLSSATVTGISDKEYTGNAVTQSPTVKLGSTTLRNGTDYYITYSTNGENVGVGPVIVTIHGKGKYTGTINKSFNITPKTLTAAMITLSPASVTYDGTLCKPEVTVRNGDIVLKAGTDYRLTNEGGTEPGSYAVTISAASNGNYTGSANKNFTIEKLPIAGAAVTLEQTSYVYDGAAKEPAVMSVVLKGETLPADSYTVSYSGNVNAGTAEAVITAAADSHYTGSVSCAFMIGRHSITASDITVGAVPDAVYARGALTPVPEVTCGETALKNKTDFTLAYESNVDAGKAGITIAGIGNYTGSRKTSFNILRKDLSDPSVTVEPVPYQEYAEGEACMPGITIRDGESVLTEADYTAAYADNEAPGTARITVTGTGNYQGTIEDIEFEILDPRAYAIQSLRDRIDDIRASGTAEYLAADQTALNKALEDAESLLKEDSATIEELSAALDAVNTAKASADSKLAAEKERIRKEQEAKAQAEKERIRKEQEAKAQAEKEQIRKEQEAKAQAEKERIRKEQEAAAIPAFAAVEKALLVQKTDSDPKGSSYAPLMLKCTKQTKTSNKLTWKKVAGVTKYVIYGNKCGKKNRIKKLATVSKTTYTHRKLKKGTYYKYIVVAVKPTVLGDRVAAVSKMIHTATKGGKAGNHKSITVSKTVVKKSGKLRTGKKLKLRPSVKAVSGKVKKHVALRYESTNKRVAKVTGKGVIKAVSKGSCYVYIYAQNGVSKRVKVIVK